MMRIQTVHPQEFLVAFSQSTSRECNVLPWKRHDRVKDLILVDIFLSQCLVIWRLSGLPSLVGIVNARSCVVELCRSRSSWEFPKLVNGTISFASLK